MPGDFTIGELVIADIRSAAAGVSLYDAFLDDAGGDDEFLLELVPYQDTDPA